MKPGAPTEPRSLHQGPRSFRQGAVLSHVTDLVRRARGGLYSRTPRHVTGFVQRIPVVNREDDGPADPPDRDDDGGELTAKDADEPVARSSPI